MHKAVKEFIILAAISLTLNLPMTQGQNISQYNKLTAKLLKGYNKNTLPTNNPNKPFEISIGAVLKELIDLNEVDEKLSTVLRFRMYWKDDSMVWNNTEYNDIHFITLEEGLTWIPYMSLLNPHHEKDMLERDTDEAKILYFKGETKNSMYDYDRLLMTTCDIDTTKFPFDKQVCIIQLVIAGFGRSFANNINVSVWFNDSLAFYQNHGTWTIYNQSVEATGSHFEITFHFKRKPTFMLINVLVPIFFLSLMTPLVFLLPNNTGERASFSITTLLAISVYMMVVSDNLPRNSYPMPLVTLMMFAWYISNSSIVVISIVNTKIYNMSETKPIPNVVRTFVLKIWPPKSSHNHSQSKSERKSTPISMRADSRVGNISTGIESIQTGKSDILSGATYEDDCGTVDTNVSRHEPDAIEPNVDDMESEKRAMKIENEEYIDVTRVGQPNIVVTWPDVSRTIDMLNLVFFYTAKGIFLTVVITYVFVHKD